MQPFDLEGLGQAKESFHRDRHGKDDRGEVLRGKEDLRGLAYDWRLGGTPIGDIGFRLEAFNIMLSMSREIDPLHVLKATRGFAQADLGAH